MRFQINVDVLKVPELLPSDVRARYVAYQVDKLSKTGYNRYRTELFNTILQMQAISKGYN